MATYTIHQQPALFQPAYNDIIFVVSSSLNTSPNFKYIADLNINGETIRLKCFPHPTYGSAVFNFGRIIETYVTSDIDRTVYGFQKNLKSFITYNVKFGQEYGPSSGVIAYPNISNTSNKYTWNGLVDFMPFQSYNQNNYLGDGGNVLNFDRGLIRKIELNQNQWLYFNQNNVASFSSGIINAYNSAGTNTRQCAVVNPFNSSGTIGNHFLRFGVGTKDLDNTTATSDFIGSGAILPAGTTRYEVSFAGTQFSSTFNFNIVDSDCRYPTYRLHWLNKMGAFESFNFIKKSKSDTTISRVKYKPPTGGLTSATAYGYNISDRGTKSFYTENKDTLYLKSDWLNDSENILLRSLIESPEIYIESFTDESGNTYNMVPVTCIDNKFSPKSSLNDKCFILDLKLEFCFSRYSQRQ